MTDTVLLDDLAVALDALSRHLAMENQILARHDAAGLEALLAEKKRLADDYAQVIAALKKQPDLVGAAPAPMKAQLRAAAEQFQAVMQEHARRVVSLKKVTEGVVKAVCDQVDARNRPLHAYSGTRTNAPKRSNTPTSIALNQRI